MLCPACERKLEEKKIGEVLVDVCNSGCGGIWFDNFEIEKIDESHEAGGQELLELSGNPMVVIHEDKRQCPKCDDVTMRQHFYSATTKVVIDHCPACNGIFLDAGELQQIRSEDQSDEEREKEIKDYFKEQFEPELKKMRHQTEQELSTARRIAHLFRFICPSYWIDEDQKWGAF